MVKTRKEMREFSRRYHSNHPGYYAKRTKEWRDRMSLKERRLYFDKYNQRKRAYYRIYSLLQGAMKGSRPIRPLTNEDRLIVQAYPLLRRMRAEARSSNPKVRKFL